MKDIKQLHSEIDKCIRLNLSPEVVKIHEWNTDSILAFGIEYQLKTIDILIWRDRGQYCVFLSASNGLMFHSTDKIVQYLKLKVDIFKPVSDPSELNIELSFIKRILVDIEKLLHSPSIDNILNQFGDYSSIPRNNKNA